MAYIGKAPGVGIRNRFIFTATAGQTVFSGVDDYNLTLSYTDAQFTDVFLNGVKLDKTDYTATSGTSIVLAEAAALNDTLEVLAFDTFSVFSGEFSQDVTVGGTITTDGLIVDTNTLYVDSTNNLVGIGTSSPIGQDISANNLVIEDSFGNGGITIKTPTTSYGSLHFSDGTGADAYRGIVSYNHSDNSMQFSTNSTERLRIDSSGNVGIGTSSVNSPSAGRTVLEVNGSSTALFHLGIGGSAKGQLYHSGSEFRINSIGTDPMTFFTNASERMRIDSSGRVGIGTSSPQGRLEINGGTGVGTSGGTLIVRQDGDANTDGIALTSSNAISHRIWKDSSGKLNIGPSSLPSALVQDLSGNIGIGTSFPIYALHIEKSNTSGNVDFLIRNSGTTSSSNTRILSFVSGASGGDPSIGVGITGVQDYFWRIDNDDSDKLKLDSNGTTRMTIDSSGNVGIGTSPTKTLDINTASATFRIRNASAGNDFAFKTTAGPVSVIGCEANTSLALMTNDTERMRIDSSGVVSFRGNNTSVQGSSYGVFINATRSNGNTNSAILGGIMVGYSGGNYGGIGYGLQSTSTSGRYVSIADDYNSFLDFTAGGFKTYTTTAVRTAGDLLDFADELVAGPYINRGAGSWTSSSDERLKQNITELDKVTAYNQIKSARAVQYNWKYGSNTEEDYIGFIAQDWETNYPEIVTTEDDAVHGVSNPKGLKYTETVPVLMAALQEAITKIETLETQNADFETRLAALEAN